MAFERRTLNFATLDDAVADAKSLLAHGYNAAGNWDLAQCCGHLAEWMRFPVEGYPKMPLVMQPMIWLIRTTSGKRMREKVLANGFTSGGRTVEATVPQAGGDAAGAVARFEQAVNRFLAYTGPLHASPLFGTMTKQEAAQLQLLHCAHHLSFLVPKSAA